ncbi:MAG: hypothetical protein QM776_08420 [Rhodocyclaceae bacterium]
MCRAFQHTALCAFLVALSSATACTTPAEPEPVSQLQSAPMIPSFVQLDVNMDSFIDRKEAAAFPDLLKVWAQADVDKDDRLSLDEFTAVLPSLIR